jgi:HAMP domain-containing protein
MSLKARLALACSGVVLLLFGVSEWLSYTQISAHLHQWEELLADSGTRATSIAHLRHEGAFLFEKLAVLWFLTALVTCVMLTAVLHYLWLRVVDTRFQQLIERIESICRGTWTDPYAEFPHDEVGNLSHAINRMGDRLTFTAHQFAAASKLAALAMVGQRLVRRVTVAREHVLAIRTML